ncbi:hypothetical protein ElyMa_005008200 [Elysia marginata]|uniref:Uncharacterized protein n=1 Tax=Elysia marginata TaxID=1093978 RepID=A0AAV4J6T8_9GAST|nr:hypothetical protein ElyMa_005008200 [Elysia marginata]
MVWLNEQPFYSVVRMPSSKMANEEPGTVSGSAASEEVTPLEITSSLHTFSKTLLDMLKAQFAELLTLLALPRQPPTPEPDATLVSRSPATNTNRVAQCDATAAAGSDPFSTLLSEEHKKQT